MQRGVWLPIGRVLLDLPRRVLTGVVLGYRLLLKPWLGNACRFEPTCSAYALQALQRHGALGGSALTGWRILRCQPWCQGGCDPVPDNFPHPAAGLFTRLRGEPQVSAQLRDDLEQQPSPPPALPDNTSVTRKIP